MLWMSFRYPASQFFLPTNAHPRKHLPVWKVAFNQCTLHSWWNFSGDSLEAPLNVYLAVLPVLGQLAAQLRVSQRMDEARAQLEHRCAGTEVSGILFTTRIPQLDRHPCTEFSLSLEKWMWSRISQILVSPKWKGEQILFNMRINI